MNSISTSPSEKALFTLISQKAKALSIQVYVVGGFVRDKMMDKRSKDIDFSCVGDSYALVESLKRDFPDMQVTEYKNFGTSQIKFNGFNLEFVTARKESYRSKSRNPDVLVGSFEDDIYRRDFTINTLAISLQEENYFELIDKCHGLEDLEKKRIKTPLEPDKTFFDDPLRMMRAIRFACRFNFTIEPEVFESIKKNKERLKIVSPERINDELNKIILSDTPSYGFKLLFKSNILSLIIPELVALAQTEEIDGRSYKNNFYHTIQVLDNVATNHKGVKLRWVALLHDIGKFVAKKYDKKLGWTFHGHEFVSAKKVKHVFKRLHLSNKTLLSYVEKIIKLHHRPISLTNEKTTDSAIRRLLFKAGDDIDDLMDFCLADITTKNDNKKNQYLKNLYYVKERIVEVEESDKIRNWKNPISGDYIMEMLNIPASKMVGDIKLEIREAILEGKIKNNFEEAKEYLLVLAKNKNLI